MSDPDPRVEQLAREFVASGKNRRACFVLETILTKGACTTDDLSEQGYEHAPRAAADVRDQGIPVITGSAISEKTGRRMAVYTLGNFDDVKDGRIGGRSAFPKAFKAALVTRYQSKDCITGATLDPKVLTIDHRIPFRVSGDAGLADRDVEAYMLLDGSSQRGKSWACEHCENWITIQDPSICGMCFWAHPEEYDHIAMQQIRRADLSFQGDDVELHDRLRQLAEEKGESVAAYVLGILRASS